MKAYLLNPRIRMYILLLTLSVITVGGTILYLSIMAGQSATPLAEEYLLPGTPAAYDYVTEAQNLIQHHVFSLSKTAPFTPDARRTPGFAIFLAFFYVLFGSFYPALVAQILTVFITAVLIFKISEKIMGKKWALAPTLLFLFSPDTMISAANYLNDNFYLFVFMIGLYIFFSSDIQNLYVRWSLAAFFLGLATYVRPTSIYLLFIFIPVYFIFYLKKENLSKRYAVAALLLIVVFMGTLAPWYVRNKNLFGIWDFTSIGAYDFFRQNGAQFYQAMTGKDPGQSREDLEDMAGIPRGPVPYDLKYSAAMKRVTWDIILSHPFRYGIFQTTSLVPFFLSSGAHEYWRFAHDMMPNFNPTPEPSLIQALNPFSLPLLVTVIINHGWSLLENILWAIVMLLVVIGLWRSKDIRLARIFFAIAIYFALVTGPISHARYRIPIEPLLLISAVSTVSYFWEKRKIKISI